MVKDRFQKEVAKQLKPITRPEVDIKLDKLTRPDPTLVTEVKKSDTFIMSKEEALGRIACKIMGLV